MSEQETNRLGRFIIQGELGRGGFATVYRALDPNLEREVALKVMHPSLLNDPTFTQRFRREARALAALRHPNIVTIYEVAEADGRLFIAMELADGPSLARLIEQRGALPWGETLALVKPVSSALDFAHSQRVVHRDLKPANILIDRLRGPLLTDFGLARLLSNNTASASMTMSGGILGTPSYIAPELWEMESAEPAADIYALGCIVHEMLNGKMLFGGETPMQILRSHDRGPQFGSAWPEGVPEGIQDVLRKALARLPQERYPSAGSFWQALEDAHAEASAAEEKSRQVALAEQWRAEAQNAIAAGEWRVAKMAIGRWLAILPDDPDARAAQDVVDRRLRAEQTAPNQISDNVEQEDSVPGVLGESVPRETYHQEAVREEPHPDPQSPAISDQTGQVPQTVSRERRQPDQVNKPAKPKNKKGLWIGAGAAGLILIAILMIIIRALVTPPPHPTPEPPPNEVGEESDSGSQVVGGTWIIATEGSFPPFEMYDDATGELIGFDIDLMNAIAEKAGVSVEYQDISYESVLSGISACEFDAAIAAITITPERAEAMAFSDPYINVGQIVSVRIDRNDINSLADLAGATIGVQEGTLGQFVVGKPENVTTKTYETAELAFLGLASGQIDAVIADYITTRSYINQFRNQIKTAGDVFTDETLGIAVCKNNPELLEQIDQALAELMQEGYLTELEIKWLGAASAAGGPEGLTGTVRVWHSWSDSQPLDNLAAAFQERNPEVMVEMIFVPNDELRDRFETETRAGSGPDLLISSAGMGPEFFNSGLVQNMDGVIPGQVFNSIYSIALESARYDGALISLPFNMNGVVLMRNRQIIPEPAGSLDELIAIAQEVTSGDVYGAYWETGFFFSAPIINGLGGNLLDENGEPAFQDGAGLDYLYLLTYIRDSGIPISNYDSSDEESFRNGQAGWIVDGTWNLRSAAEAIGEENLVIDLWPAPLSGYTVTDNVFISTSVQPENLSAATSFAVFMSSTEGQEILVNSESAVLLFPVTAFVQISDPLIEMAMDALAAGTAFPILPEMNEYWPPMNEMVMNVIIDDRDPSAELETAYDRIATAVAIMHGE